MKEKIYHTSLSLCIANLIFFAVSSIISLTTNVNFAFVIIIGEQEMIPISFPVIFLALTGIFLLLAMASDISKKEVDPNKTWENLRKILKGSRIPHKQ